MSCPQVIKITTPGPTGPQGPAGPAGVGSLWRQGSGAPSAGLGSNGDFYLDTSTGDIYGPKAAGAWGSPIYSIQQGQTGPAGPTGDAGPAIELQVAGGFIQWRVVGAAQWTNLIATASLTGPQGPQGDTGAQGPQGPQGNTILSGSGAPSSGTGANGDFYLDVAASRLYGPKSAGAWGSGTLLKSVASATAPLTYDASGGVVGINVGTDPGDVVQLDASGNLPAVNGANLTGLPPGITDLAYDQATRVLSSSTGNDATLPLFATDGSGAGLVPGSSTGGTTNFLRADGTWAAPPSSPPGGSNGQVQVNNNGAFGGLSTLTADASGNLSLSARLTNSFNSASAAPAKHFTGTWITGAGTTNTKPHILIEPAGTTSTAWSNSGTGLGINAASGFAGNLLDLQVNGTSAIKIDSNGAIIYHGNTGRIVPISSNGSINFTNSAGTPEASYVNQSGGLTPRFSVASHFAFAWSSTTNSTQALDILLFRDAAGTLAQRNGTNAQTFRVYGTFTDASNYVRAALSSTSTAVTLAAETAGSGADDITLNLTAAGTGTVKVNSNLETATKNIVTDTSTGTKIGTSTSQKLGFWNATPVDQPAAVADAVDTTDVVARLNDVLSRLRETGLIAT